MNDFTNNGIRVYSFDQRGFGQTLKLGGKIGHHEGMKVLKADVEHLAQKLDNTVPKFIMGQSMGGLWALYFSVTSSIKWNGVIACSPAIDVGTPIPFWKKYPGKLMAALFPSVSVDSDLGIFFLISDTSNLSHNKDVVENYLNDPLVHGQVSVGLANDILLIGEFVRSNTSKFTLPVFVSHGTLDILTSYSASEKFVRSIPSEKKTFSTFENGFHERNYILF